MRYSLQRTRIQTKELSIGLYDLHDFGTGYLVGTLTLPFFTYNRSAKLESSFLALNAWQEGPMLFGSVMGF